MALNLTFWDNQQNPVNTTVDRIMDALRNEDMREGLMYEPCTMDDVLDGTQPAEALIMDAIVSQYSKLTAKMNIMQRAMTRSGATVDGVNEKGEKIDIPLTVVGYQISDPFMRLGTANVVALFELSDGQTVSIYFHNPDVTPKKITPQDEVISFKWLLNKKDITIVVAPERGKDINALQVAMRIMKIAAKNSAAFARQNKNRAEKLAKVAALRERVAEKEKILAQRVKKIDELKYLKSQEELDRLDEEDRLMKGEITASLYQELKERNRLEDRQDELDNLFNTRISAIRSALQKEGWNGEFYKELNKEGIYLKTEWETTKDTGNTLGMSYHIPEVDFHYVDDLTDKPEEIAQKINAAIQPLLAKLLAEQKANAQTDKKDEEEQPIIITGKEFGEFDTSTKEGKEKFRAVVREHLENNLKGKWIKNKALNQEIEIRQRGIDELITWSANLKKLQIAAVIEQVIATAKPKDGIEPWEDNTKKVKKPDVKGYYRFTNRVNIAGENVSFDVLIEQDEKGLLHYDFILPRKPKAIMDNVEIGPDTKSGKDQQTTMAFVGEDNNAILDSAQEEYMINIILLDKDGNEIKDEEESETDELIQKQLANAQSKVEKAIENGNVNELTALSATLERLSKAQTVTFGREDVQQEYLRLKSQVEEKIADLTLTDEERQDKENYEKVLEDKANRKRAMSEEMKSEFAALLRQYGFDEHYLDDIPDGSTSFYVGKEQDGLKVDIEAAFTGSQVERHQDAYYDFTVTGDKTALVGDEADDRYAYFYTNSFEDALKWANEWLGNNKGEPMQTTENPQEQADRQFLQDVIDGKVDVLADDFYDKLEPIANRVYAYDEGLVSKAIDAYANKTDEYAIATE